MKSLILGTLLLFIAGTTNAQCVPACNNLTNLAVEANTPTEVRPDMILEGSYVNCGTFSPVVNLKDNTTGQDIPTSPYVSSDQVGTEILATVTDVSTGSSCWGLLKVESIANLNSGIRDCNGRDINNLSVKLISDNPNVNVTQGSCQYDGSNLLEYVNCTAAINALPANTNYILRVERNETYVNGHATSYNNGVSTLDQVLIQRHILGINTFEGETCKLIAADVTNEGRITALDLVEMRKLILAIYTELPNSSSWRFYNKKSIDGSSTIPGSADLTFGQDEFPLSELEVVGIKIGDVNYTAAPGK